MEKIILLIALSLLYQTGIAAAACSGSGAAYSCSADSTVAQIQAAVDAVTEGGTVTIGAGSGTWESGITISKSLTLIGTTTGCPTACNDGTVITGSGSGTMIAISTNGDKTIDISGLTLNANLTQSIIISITNSNTTAPLYNLRIHGNEIEKSTSVGIIQLSGSQDVFSLIDNNKFTDNANYDIAIYGPDTSRPWASWPGVDYFGTREYLYIEDNISSGCDHYPIVSGRASRFVVRYNTIDITLVSFSGIDVHGDTLNYGVVATEIYENNITGTFGTFRFVDLRGGASLIFNNTLSTNISTPYIQPREEYNNGGCEDPAHPESLRVNNAYFWNNKKGTSIIEVAESDSYGCISEKTNWWDDYNNSPQYFTVGVDSARPEVAGSNNDVYYATDTEKLYRAITGTTWTQVYTPYAYPHPLRGESTPTLTISAGVHIGGGIEIK